MTLPINHSKEYMALVVAQMTQEMRAAELVRVALFRRRKTDAAKVSP